MQGILSRNLFPNTYFVFFDRGPTLNVCACAAAKKRGIQETVLLLKKDLF
jgi:hypothetical protein